MKIVQPDLKVPTDKGNCRITVWAKLCYADENLKVSKGEFERPPNLLYKKCYNAPAAKKTAYATKYR
jgi:hypothetical protein